MTTTEGGRRLSAKIGPASVPPGAYQKKPGTHGGRAEKSIPVRTKNATDYELPSFCSAVAPEPRSSPGAPGRRGPFAPGGPF